MALVSNEFRQNVMVCYKTLVCSLCISVIARMTKRIKVRDAVMLAQIKT
jgi:hypothetical protein